MDLMDEHFTVAELGLHTGIMEHSWLIIALRAATEILVQVIVSYACRTEILSAYFAQLVAAHFVIYYFVRKAYFSG